ncbi:tail length tape measure protein [Synechococcus phage S-CBS2]|uniref:tail length tape measure protein n=1 Tax=Synechococcus phage S-CBS2 TaxID=753084 RepID=UPI00020783EE|nr:tail length tape measure protein [Synechococcus phage S-CBS2]ADF42377.1 tail tape measure protein [Synechococcus phage S-CBS2]
MADKQLRYSVSLDNAQALAEFDELFRYAQNGSVAAARVLNQELGGTVKTVLDWEVRVDDTGVKRLQPVVKEVLTEYDKLNNKASQLNKTQEGSITNLRQQANQAKQVRDGIEKIASKTDVAANTVKGKLNPAWVEADANVKRINIQLAEAEGNLINIAKARFPEFAQFLSLGNSLTQIAQVAKTVADVFVLVNQAVQPLIQREKQIQALSLALSAFITDQGDVNAVLASSKGIALEYGGSLTQIERAYKRIAPAILASGGTLNDVEAVIESLTAKTTQLGLNTEQAGRYIEAFAQVMGKGKLQSEELNQQFSELDGALRSQVALYLETRYGITDLNEAMKNGEVTAGLFREAFIDAAQSARDQLAGALGEVQSRIDELNIQQIENIRSTLNTISLESLNESFAGFGMSMQAIQTAFAQFFAALTTNLPGIKKGFTDTFTVIGKVLEFVVIGFLNGLQAILFVIDQLVQGFYALRDAILSIPGVDTIVQSFQSAGVAVSESFRQGTDAILGLGASVDTAKGQFSQFDTTLEQLNQKFEAGEISQQDYDKSLRQLYQNATDGSKALLDAYNSEQEAINTLKEAVDAKFEQEKERINELIDAKKEALSQEKEDLKGTLDTFKDIYDQRKQAIDDEITKVKDRYAAELDFINAQTPAQQEQIKLRKEKLQATINSAEASYEEKVAAQASLDTMIQQEKSAEIRKKQAEELKTLEKQKAEEQKKYEEARKAAEEASLERQRGLEDAIKSLTDELKSNEQKQADYNKQLDESVRLNDDLIDTVDDIPGLIAQQVQQAQNARDAYWEAATAANAVADAIERANRARANAPTTTQQRFAGGPVSGGQVYTVNELGKEGFLSASGKLSAINAPAWGQWRAPGAGTVIPADVFATVNATGSVAGASMASANVSGSSGVDRLASVIQALASSGGNVQNNVTIQSANTTKAASDILVELTKIRRRRYS